MIPLESVDYDTFAPRIGETFISPPALELRLETVRKLGERRSGALRDPFSLTFRGAPGLRLPQGIRGFTCEGLGEIELFITQVADGPQGAEFEAVFT